jgi:hypothetical protein
LHTIARRSRTRARIITVVTLSGAVVVVGGGALAIALTGGPRNGILVAYVFAALAILAVVVVFGLLTARHSRAMRVLAERHPDAVVFLARRLPPVVSDMPAYLRAKGLPSDLIGDGWYPAIADSRGVAVCSTGRDPQEIVLIEWPEVGKVEMVRTATVGGDSRWSVIVDVKPYVVPLTVDLGDAWGIITMGLDAGDTAAVVKAVAAKRHASDGG